MSSFWMDWILMSTPGCSASKSFAVCSQYALPGPVVELCQKVSSTEPSPESSPPALHPARVPTASAATAPSVTSRVMLRLFIIEPLESFDDLRRK